MSSTIADAAATSRLGIYPKRVDHRPLRVLIHRVGSLGDTLVALPALRLVAAAFPNARRILLSNQPVSGVALPAEDILAGLDLAHESIRYAPGASVRSAFSLIRAVRAAAPDVVVSLLSRPEAKLALRDRLFFLAAGVRHQYGLGLCGRGLRAASVPPALVEPEAARLARLLRPLGEIDLAQPDSWKFPITPNDRIAVESVLPGWRWEPGDITVALGTKMPANDWGDERWHELLHLLSPLARKHRLLCIGAGEDHSRSAALMAQWPGRAENLCGRLDLRGTATVLAASRLMIGHDSGPLHLAAAVGTSAVAVFSRRNPLGQWFPLGRGHSVHYVEVPCAGCELVRCEAMRNRCTREISAERVAADVLARLS